MQKKYSIVYQLYLLKWRSVILISRHTQKTHSCGGQTEKHEMVMLCLCLMSIWQSLTPKVCRGESCSFPKRVVPTMEYNVEVVAPLLNVSKINKRNTYICCKARVSKPLAWQANLAVAHILTILKLNYHKKDNWGYRAMDFLFGLRHAALNSIVNAFPLLDMIIYWVFPYTADLTFLPPSRPGVGIYFFWGPH